MDAAKIDKIMQKAGRVHFIGIGGISMSSLAMITHVRGVLVSGSDRSESDTVKRLREAGISVSDHHDASLVNGADLVVYTAAIHPDNPEYAEAERQGIPLCSRASYLGWLMSRFRERIGVAGSHGKSTVTSMLTEIYLAGNLDPTVVSGAELSSIGGAYRLGGQDTFLFEACEYCDSFLSFLPTTAIVTNIEYDHADYFKDMDQLRDSFRRYIKIADRAVVNADDPETKILISDYPGDVVSFGISDSADYSASDVSLYDGGSRFMLTEKGRTLGELCLKIPGLHNVKNALAAAAACRSCNVPFEAIRLGLFRFTGAKRRFERMGVTENGAEVYNDYAHHPSEIKATLAAAKTTGKRIVCVFQPHTFSRTKALYREFSQSFSDADRVIFADIYAARETNESGVSSKQLAADTPRGEYLDSKKKIIRELIESTGEGDLILILGAGDIVSIGRDLIRS